MDNPYQVLGASPTDSDEEIKKKYRDLVKKYHPDNYHNNPLADLAQEKMKAINEAYDAIQKQRSGTGSGGQTGYGNTSGSYQSYGGYQSQGSAQYRAVRAAINSGNLDYAQQLLDAARNRDAEWYFLMGSLSYRRGWMDEAQRHFQRAVAMDPSNAEYREALSRMQSGGTGFRPMGFGTGGLDACDICSALMCANLCCNCH